MRIGIDLGGTKIEGIVMDDARETRHLRRRPTPIGQAYDDIVAAVVDLVGELEAEIGERGTVGIGTPGSISRVSGPSLIFSRPSHKESQNSSYHMLFTVIWANALA